MNVLCLDCGNSRIKWALRPICAPIASPWLVQGACPTAQINALNKALDKLPPPHHIIACNVAGKKISQAITRIATTWACPLTHFSATASFLGVRNAYSHPEQLGADRWAALIAAHHLHRGATIVVLCGTATTLDILYADGRHAGGYILPGLSLMSAALAHATAQLPPADTTHAWHPDEGPATHTEAAIGMGVRAAVAGAAERAFASIQTEANAICLLDGGDAALVAPWLRLPYRQVDGLVLEGLSIAARYNMHPC